MIRSERRARARQRCYRPLVPIASFLRRLKRLLTPPGNRPPVDEAGQTRPGLKGGETGSPGSMTDRWP
jgi:hypothetical protein